MTDYIQEKFEEWFVREKQLKNDEWKRKDHSGDYVNVIIQDHYDCFEKWWIACIKEEVHESAVHDRLYSREV